MNIRTIFACALLAITGSAFAGQETGTKVGAEHHVDDSEQVEQAAWNTALRHNTRDSYAVYLVNYPKGRFRDLARIKVLDVQCRVVPKGSPRGDAMIVRNLPWRDDQDKFDTRLISCEYVAGGAVSAALCQANIAMISNEYGYGLEVRSSSPAIRLFIPGTSCSSSHQP
jgi:hypothetical protein